MRRLISAALLAASTVAYGQGAPVKEVMAALASAKASRASFVETKTSSLLKAPVVLRGTLAYRRPDFLEKQVREPYEERIVLSGDVLTVQNGARSTTLTASGAPLVAALVQGMRAVRAGDLAALERYFEVSVSGARERWTMTLAPSAVPLADYVSRVTISGAEGRITSIDVQEPGGDRSVMQVREELQ